MDAQTAIKNKDEKRVNKELREKFIVLEVENEQFVIPLEYVSEIVRVEQVTEAPHQPDWVRGIMNLRDSVITLIDTRKRLGVKTMSKDEAHNVVEAGRKAHVNWFETLKDCISKKEPFTLNMDPNLCGFGKWSHGMTNSSETKDMVKQKLREMKSPHELFHATGRKALDALAKGDEMGVTECLVELKEIYLPRMLSYFDELEAILMDITGKGIAVILEYHGAHFAMSADDITKMKTFKLDSRQTGALTNNQFVMGVFEDTDGLYQELDLEGVLKGANNQSIIPTEQEEEPAAK
jgi:chemotaxis signal transduction protein